MLRAVVDTNVWVSALLNPNGHPAAVLEAFRNGRFHAGTSVIVTFGEHVCARATVGIEPRLPFPCALLFLGRDGAQVGNLP